MRRIGDHYVADTAVVVGDVTIGPEASIWYGAVVRGDVAPIRIGARVNVQDGAVLHCKHGVPLEIADDVVIAHQAVVHCRRVGSRSLIAIRATLLDDVEIGEDCVIAAGAIVTPGTKIPPGSVVMGVPGKVVRPISEDERAYIDLAVHVYRRLAPRHANGEFALHRSPVAGSP